jgi:hypothetical protein
MPGKAGGEVSAIGNESREVISHHLGRKGRLLVVARAAVAVVVVLTDCGARARAAERARPALSIGEPALVVAAEAINLRGVKLPVGTVLIANNTMGQSGAVVLSVHSLHGQSLDVSDVKVVTLRDGGGSPRAAAEADANADNSLPLLIRRQPKVVHDAWRQIAATIRDNRLLARPRPEPFFARAELWMMVGNYDEAMRDLLLAMQTVNESGVSPRIYDAIFERLRQVLERYDAMPVPPEDGEPVRHYGCGVHAFWAGRYGEADKDFTNAITLAPKNPVYWYMRAVSRRRLGDDRAATHDALLGVAAERQACARSSIAVSNINRELRRLQGPDRLWLEDHRRGNPSRRTLSGMKEEGSAAAVR